jgi:hypothetical protein
VFESRQGARDSSLPQNVQTCSGAHITFLWRLTVRGVKLTANLSLVRRLRIHEAIHPLSYAFTQCVYITSLLLLTHNTNKYIFSSSVVYSQRSKTVTVRLALYTEMHSNNKFKQAVTTRTLEAWNNSLRISTASHLETRKATSWRILKFCAIGQ